VATDPDPAELLAWDSEFWGLTIGRVRGERLDPALLAEVDGWAAREGIDCLYLVARDEAGTVRTAERGGFDLVEARLTLTHSVGEPPLDGATGGVREHRPEDLPALESLARRTPYVSRFAFDERFPRERLADYHAAWIAFADAVLVAESAGRIDGYITCRVAPRGGDASLGIVAVEEDRRQAGVADALMVEAIRWLAGRGMETVSVDVAARNVRTQRYVQRQGFVTSSFRLCFHKWYR